MDAPSTTQSTKPSTSQRAKVACVRCNTRRVKCDVSYSGQPCRNCRTRNVACEVLSSRRGKYPRTQSKRHASSGLPSDSINTDLSTLPPPSSLATIPSPVDGSHQQNHVSPPLIHSPNNGTDSGQDTTTVEEGSEMLFARMTDASPEQMTSEPYRDGGRTFYLGEPFSLAFVVKTVCSPSGETLEDKVHYPIPRTLDDSARNVFHDKSLAPEDLASLRAKGAYDLPPKHVGERLLLTFFEGFYPAYPVFDRREIASLYEEGRLSYLVLHTIFYIAITICDDDLLHETGFANRYQARLAYYVRAKALYDADQERDKVKLTAVLFLLGFWWQGPEDQKDSWYWLGAAIGLGQTLGMHRSTAKSGLSPSHQSLWKRIWWSIYVRDRHSAAALGRPLRINDDDCDVEQMDVSDFDVAEGEFLQISGTHKHYHTLYAIEMSKLAILLGRVLKTEYSAGRRSNPHESDILARELYYWEQHVPPELSLGQLDSTLGAPFWARMLHASFNNTQILLYRPRCIGIESPAAAERDAYARAAADATTRLVEDLLSAGTLRQGQLHLVPALFAALSVHAIVVRRRDTIHSQLAENRSRQCMLALSELSKSWPVGGWILQLFVNLLKRLTGRDFGFQVNANSTKHDDTRDIQATALREDPGQRDSTRLGVFGLEAEITSNQQFMMTPQTQDLNTQDPWQFGEDLLPSDFLFQDAFGAFPSFQRALCHGPVSDY